MSKQKKNKSRATLVMALPLAVAGLTFGNQTAQALPLAAGITQQQDAVNHPISKAEKINPTTVEITYADGKRLTMDFYGENIFRLFRDDKGGIVRDPQATPPATILANSARRATMGVDVQTDNATIQIATDKICVSLDKRNGLMTVTNKRTGKAVIESVAPVAFDKNGTTLTFKARDNEYFYGGGVQNGRFSHKGKAIAIENTNNWVVLPHRLLSIGVRRATVCCGIRSSLAAMTSVQPKQAR